jgi:hypothetical protein
MEDIVYEGGGGGRYTPPNAEHVRCRATAGMRIKNWEVTDDMAVMTGEVGLQVTGSLESAILAAPNLWARGLSLC